MSELADLSAGELLRSFTRGEASPREAVESCLTRIEALEPSVSAVATLVAEHALGRADEAGARWSSGNARPLEGLPVGIKDVIATAGIRTAGGSRAYEEQVPERSATCVQRLEAAGAIVVAKLQTFELALADPVPEHFARNPWDLERTPGGSSDGPAAAVAARELPLALGTDTGGSIRVPAAYCGVVGLKPTYGRVSRAGVMPLAWTLDHVGPLARSVEDAARCLAAVAGFDPADPTSSRRAADDYLVGLENGVAGMRIGIPSEFFFEVCDPQIEAATRRAGELLVSAGAVVEEVPFPNARLAEGIRATVFTAEAAAVHGSDETRLSRLGSSARRAVLSGHTVSAVDYIAALRARHLVQQDFEAAFERVDAVLSPGAISIAPRLEDMQAVVGDRTYPWLEVSGRPTLVHNVAGVPAIVVPAGVSDEGLPIAVQFACRPFAEATCLRIARAYEHAAPALGAPPVLAPG